MKVLRVGPAFERKVECARCSSLLLVEEGDVRYDEAGYHFSCGKCLERNSIGNLPEFVMNTARQEFERGQMYGR